MFWFYGGEFGKHKNNLIFKYLHESKNFAKALKYVIATINL